MKILFIAVLVNLQIVFACPTCSFMAPTAALEIEVELESSSLQKLHIVWNFSDIYTNVLTQQYDKNSNKKLDDEELNEILQLKLDYLKPNKMLTHIKYTENNNSRKRYIDVKFENFLLKTLDGFLYFSYDAKVNQEIDGEGTLFLEFNDAEFYFMFSIMDIKVKGGDFFYKIDKQIDKARIFFKKTEKDKPLIQTKIPKDNNHNVDIKKSYLQESMQMIQSLFKSIKNDGTSKSYILLLFFAYIYGLIHALGPGHGKSLVASYFLSNGRSYKKAVFVSLAIGVVHTFSAFILTLIIYSFVSLLMAQLVDNAIFFTTKISAVMIISIAIYLIYKKYRFYAKANKLESYNFISGLSHESSCGCGMCKVGNQSTDIALIVSAGIIPCPGTTTLFIFAFSTGLYLTGFVSALVMSLGMSSVIFISALLSTFFRKKVLKSASALTKYLEFISLSIVFLLGLFLLLA
jgi:nickel/cobalt transporter (NicO) family protein